MLVNRIKAAFTVPIEVPAGVPLAEVVDGALLAKVLPPQPKKIALLYGDWSNQPGFHGSQSTMGVCLHRVLADEFLLLRVNEFRTSRLCPMCHGPVVPQR
ncbi:hypothetical protein BC828DRAFT_377079 [Blastocladiella britannica]|nr:hypothetical protein BC828DRAFT_377079 [Blastocladiella britannica]